MNPYCIPGIDRPEIVVQLGEIDEKLILKAVVNFVNNNLGMVSDIAKPVDINLLFGPTRKREYALTRHIYMYYMRKAYPRTSLNNLGKSMGVRHHSTVIHGIQTINNLLDIDKKFAAKMAVLSKHLGL